MDQIQVDNNNGTSISGDGESSSDLGKPVIVLLCGSLVYYHCAYRNSSPVSLFSDVLIVILCSLAMLGMLFRQMNISVPVDPLEWQISQDTANAIIAWFANTVGAAESVLRVAATGHDKRLFLKLLEIQPREKVAICGEVGCGKSTLLTAILGEVPYIKGTVVGILYLLSALGRVASGATIAYAGLCLFCVYVFAQSSPSVGSIALQLFGRKDSGSGTQDDI